MALIGTATIWASSVIAAIDTTGLTAGEITTIQDAWEAILGIHISHLTGNTLVSTTVTGVTGTGPAGGPLPITTQPGVGGIS